MPPVAVAGGKRLGRGRERGRRLGKGKNKANKVSKSKAHARSRSCSRSRSRGSKSIGGGGFAGFKRRRNAEEEDDDDEEDEDEDEDMLNEPKLLPFGDLEAEDFMQILQEEREVDLVFSYNGIRYISHITSEAHKAHTEVHVGIPAADEDHDEEDYPAGNGAQCIQLSAKSDGTASLDYLQARSYFNINIKRGEIRNVPLRHCSMPALPTDRAGRVWLEVTRQLCQVLGIQNLSIHDAAEVQVGPNVPFSVSAIKLFTEGQGWYERELGAIPQDVDAAEKYLLVKQRLQELTMLDLFKNMDLVRLAEVDGGPSVKLTDTLIGKDGVVARVFAGAKKDWSAFRKILLPSSDKVLLDELQQDDEAVDKLKDIMSAVYRAMNLPEVPKMWMPVFWTVDFDGPTTAQTTPLVPDLELKGLRISLPLKPKNRWERKLISVAKDLNEDL